MIYGWAEIPMHCVSGVKLKMEDLWGAALIFLKLLQIFPSQSGLSYQIW